MVILVIMRDSEQVKYWLSCAEQDLAVAEHLFTHGYYIWSLFIGHLVIEKMLKAFYVKDNFKIPPKIHNLLILAESTRINLTSEQKKLLFEINGFNIETRYPEEKMTFYKICDQKFANEYFTKIKELYLCLKEQMK
ncbi:MAG: HEPN domain-containing protein [Candidatus Hydrogenedentota bacterium]